MPSEKRGEKKLVSPKKRGVAQRNIEQTVPSRLVLGKGSGKKRALSKKKPPTDRKGGS